MSLTAVRLEPLNETHIAGILEIEKEANGSPWSERSFRSELDNPDRIFLVALSMGRVVGYGGVWLMIDEAHVTTVAVAPDLRRQGIGWKLMVELLARSQEAGMLCSTLEVRAGNVGAIELYRRLGYVETARRKKYYPDNAEDAVVMWLFDLVAWERPQRVAVAADSSDDQEA